MRNERAMERIDLLLRDIAMLLKYFSPNDESYLGDCYDPTSDGFSPLV
jgi:hypothetical protein